MSGKLFMRDLRSFIHRRVSWIRPWYYRRFWGMKLGEGVHISLKAHLDFTNPTGIHIGDHTIVTPGVRIFTHDFVNARHVDTHIGAYCFIGAGAIILPGTRIGDHCIVGAGSVVTSDVPSRSVVAGNPARILRSDIKTGRFGILVGPTVR